MPLLAESSRADLRRFTQADLDRIAAELKAALDNPSAFRHLTILAEALR